MNDLNFFSIYQGSRREQTDEKIYFLVPLGILLGIIIITFTINIVQIVKIDNDIKGYTEKLEASDVQSQLKEAEDINGRIKVLSNYEASLSDVANSIKRNDIVSDELLVDICNAMPGDISFKDFDVEGYDVNINGTTHTRAAVGEFEHNLRGLPEIKDVHVNEIAKTNKVGEDYSFKITCILKEVE